MSASDAVLRARARELLRALNLHDTEANMAKVLLVLATIDRSARKERDTEMDRMQKLLDDANKMLGRMASERAGGDATDA